MNKVLITNTCIGPRFKCEEFHNIVYLRVAAELNNMRVAVFAAFGTIQRSLYTCHITFNRPLSRIAQTKDFARLTSHSVRG